MPNVFETPEFAARELQPADVPALQAFFDANPAYFRNVNGRDARADEAQTEFDELPPAHMAYTRQWKLGLWSKPGGAMVGVATGVVDLFAPGVWHTGLFIVADALHGSGFARRAYAALEAWMIDSGARWLRLGVVVGNARAERFWERNGYVQSRLREGIDTGGRLNTLRAMMKPVGAGSLEEYRSRVPRDRPGADLA